MFKCILYKPVCKVPFTKHSHLFRPIISQSVYAFQFRSIATTLGLSSPNNNDRLLSSTKDLISAMTLSKNNISKLFKTIDEKKNWEVVESKASDLRDRLKDDNLWTTDTKEAIEIQKDISRLESEIAEHSKFTVKWNETQSMIELAKEEGDDTLLKEVVADMEDLEAQLRQYFIKSLMTDEVDQSGCYIEIRAGAGGAESCDWVSMLTRMYERWGADQGHTVTSIAQVKGDVAGLKSSTTQIQGDYAYGWSKNESGVHRFVRVSPFDSNAKRHTSFVSVQVLPILSTSRLSTKTIEISTNELKLEFMRAQGAGGQHVNKTESAVRMTHIPTGITVFCQSERSQVQNKATALEMLKSKLYQVELDKLSRQKQEHHANLGENAWGNHIRSYVLQPYQLVKDTRTGTQTTNVQDVLNGGLQEFMESALLFSHKP
ncbi:hypothetical protein O5D80_000293 [Batrachochytrium dendrobatidis]|nr:hypothetical protein O5D80_000293 [Batrachochytrium dendrobatidis]